MRGHSCWEGGTREVLRGAGAGAGLGRRAARGSKLQGHSANKSFSKQSSVLLKPLEADMSPVRYFNSSH